MLNYTKYNLTSSKLYENTTLFTDCTLTCENFYQTRIITLVLHPLQQPEEFLEL